MDKESVHGPHGEQEAPGVPPGSSSGKKPWEQPKLAFVEPKLTKHGNLQEVTGQERDGFFGGFTT